ncbi:jg27410, partial [Pararge aegeria aegeria]
YSQILWPWSGWLALSFTVLESGVNFDGVVEGHVNVTIESFDELHDRGIRNTTLMLPIRYTILFLNYTLLTVTLEIASDCFGS